MFWRIGLVKNHPLKLQLKSKWGLEDEKQDSKLSCTIVSLTDHEKHQDREKLLQTECLCPPQNLYVETLTFNVMVLGGGAFGR